MFNWRKYFKNLTIEGQSLHHRLSVIFALFFLCPILGFLYFAIRYEIWEDHYIPLFFIAFLALSFFGYTLIRGIFSKITGLQKKLSGIMEKTHSSPPGQEAINEMEGVIDSVQSLEKELKVHFGNLDRKISQQSTLKELADLCYITFNSEDLFHITLERAMRMVNADVGSVMILDKPQRDNFVITATFGLGDIAKKGDCIPFAESIAKFAVINKTPLIVDDIEKDDRFGRQNRNHYGTKSFLCMPLRGIHEVFGVLTLSRRHVDQPFVQDDADVLTPLLSSVAFTYDNLALTKYNGEQRKVFATMEALYKLTDAGDLDEKILPALLYQLRNCIPFDLAVILVKDEEKPELMKILDFLAYKPVSLLKGGLYPLQGSILDKVLKQEPPLWIDDMNSLDHFPDQTLLTGQGMSTAVLAPMRAGGRIQGILILAAESPESLRECSDSVVHLSRILGSTVAQQRTRDSLMRRDREMNFLKRVGEILAASTFDLNEVLSHTIAMIQTVIAVEAGYLLLREGEDLIFKVHFNNIAGVNLEKLRDLRLKIGQGIAGYCAARSEALIVNRVSESRQFYAEPDRRTGFTTRSVLCVPLVSNGQVLGVIEVANKSQGDFTDGDLQLMQSIAASVGIALENARLYQKTLSLAEHERGIRNMFQKFVPKEIVDRILLDPLAARGVVDEMKTITFLNIDIRGFSQLSTRLAPQKLVAMLNYFFGVMGDIVFKHHGVVDKYLGDGFLALFGAPVTMTSDPDNAVAAALEMRESMVDINAYFEEEIGESIAMGISIHTGEAVVGNIGFDKKMDYTVIGNSVNTVFRLQELTRFRNNGIVVSEKTRQAVMCSVLEVKPLHIADMADLKVYELLGRQDKQKRVPAELVKRIS
jgi:class 3 adenylate cyclase/GAF domain-containing protein